jgi:hypothetical protein
VQFDLHEYPVSALETGRNGLPLPVPFDSVAYAHMFSNLNPLTRQIADGWRENRYRNKREV